MIKQAPSVGRIVAMVAFTMSCFGILLFLWISFGGPAPLRPDSYRLRVAFPEATQLAQEAEVRISGVPVGEGAIYPWSSGHNIEYFGRLMTALGDALGFTLKTRWSKLTKKQQQAFLQGTGVGKVQVRYKNRYGRVRSYTANFEGVVP